jgi:hypothetical protein
LGEVTVTESIAEESPAEWDDMLSAAASSAEFWDNRYDDEDGNKA